MFEMKTTVKNECFEVKRTGRDYDFIATIENNTDLILAITPADFEEPFYIEPNDWVGLLADDEGYYTLEALENGKYEIETFTKSELADRKAA